MQREIKEKLTHYMDAGFPFIYLHTFDEMNAEKIIQDVSKTVCREVVEWNGSIGQCDWKVKDAQIVRVNRVERSLEQTLDMEKEEKALANKILLIKDVHHYFDQPRIISLLKYMANEVLSGLETTIIFVSSVLTIPKELENFTTVLEVGHLEDDEIEKIILEFIDVYDLPSITDKFLHEAVTAFKGLTDFEIKNILALAYSNDGSFTKSDLNLIHEQKRQIIKKSGILEMIELKESLDDIGGLENLKKWLKKKGAVFTNFNQAFQFGVDMPKGVLIAGVPGCGKSLNAKAAAKLFDVPLLRLDMGRLLGKYVGESEANMRKAISLAEAIAPTILWIDEIEKAFAGIGASGGGNDVTTRLFGNFLTWMQEKKSAVFVVATANDILHLPPELLRKGRFDEIFYVGLPKDNERKKIFEIHIAKRRKQDIANIDFDQLVQKTKGFSGADIEGVVKDAIETVFADRKSEVKTENIVNAINDTHSLSEIMKESLEKMTKEYERRKFKNASL